MRGGGGKGDGRRYCQNVVGGMRSDVCPNSVRRRRRQCVTTLYCIYIYIHFVLVRSEGYASVRALLEDRDRSRKLGREAAHVSRAVSK